MGVVLFIDTQTLILIIIAFIVLVIWGGPSKIPPQLARSLGQSIREFKRGASESEPEPELIEIARKLGIDPTGKSRDELLTEINNKLGQQQRAAAEKPSVDPKVLEIAERLGIDTRGKSEEDLIKEINWRLSNK
ncbi:twin-arginine translocase TatA/TatE family subunit [Vulcanisaeta distributa]|uniref:twin-arginine translocase TatA/TatE family subunit n=1 Tax=Vulcanisaeta distributa TaxID=164451 RepID=UPI0006D06E13|nr:twin-arginine translocase TatA/TatE family subunit [Vulcanisaeta distributa]